MSSAALAFATIAVLFQTQPDSCAKPVQIRLDEHPVALVRGLDELSAKRPHFLLPAATPIRVCSDALPVLANWSLPDQQRRLRIAPLQVRALRNSAYPRTVNDGVLW